MKYHVTEQELTYYFYFERGNILREAYITKKYYKLLVESSSVSKRIVQPQL